MPERPTDERLDYAALTPDEREQSIDRLAALGNRMLDEMFRVIVASDSLDDYKADGAIKMSDWLSYRCNVSTTTANQWVRAANALEDLPRVRERFATGDISFEQLTHALSFAKPEDDADLAELLPSLSCFEIELMAKRRRKLRRHDADSARRKTQVRLRSDRSGLGSRIFGFMPTEDAAVVEAALNRRAEAAGPDPETGFWAPHEERTAGALRDLCAEDLARSAAAGSEPDSSIVVVHAPAVLLDAQLSDEERDEAGNATINGQPIVDDALHRILCDARIEISYDTPNGRTIGVRRATRNPPSWLRRRVIGRDHGHCRWPGCNRPIRHLHHMTHWTKGGATDACNLMGVCWHHHHLLHEGGWNATGDADDEVVVSNEWREIRSRAGPEAA